MLVDHYRDAALAAYRAYNHSPMQDRLKAEAPCLVGAVYWNPQQDTAEQIRYELQRMRETGFTFVRFHAIDPIEHEDGNWDFTYPDLRLDISHECGLLVYPHMGLHKPSMRLLREAGLTLQEARLLGLEDERVEAAIRHRMHAIVEHYQDHPAVAAWPMQGEPPATGIPLRDDYDKGLFEQWLRERYASPAEVHAAWLIYPDVRRDFFNEQGAQILHIEDWGDAVAIASAIADRQPGAAFATTAYNRHQLFGANRDLVRFRADRTEAAERKLVSMIKEIDPDKPVCYGNHQFMYANGQLGWDQHRCGRTGDMHFSSIHLSWHFEPVQGEFDRPHYMQSRLTNDIFKGGYTNCYETTGGPVQYSGGYGNHMDAPMMRKLMLNFLAAGNEGIAFWDWNPRPGGIEAGEYGLISLAGRITEWAEEAGHITRAMAQHSNEIWNWSIDPELAIVRSWDTETVMTCEPRRFEVEDGPTPWSRGPAQQHVRAWIGASRAAIDEQVDYQYLTTDEILAGLAGVYPAIYLPHVRCIDDDVLARLQEYVEQGGHLIADVQIGFEDNFGKVRQQGEGTRIEQIFGAWVDTIHDAHSRPQSVDGVDCPGFFGELVCTGATVVQRFDTGKPAVVERRLGAGRATLIGFDAARACWQASPAMERLLGDLYRGPRPRRFSCPVPMTFRRSHADADHFFIVNDGQARSTVLRVYDHNYSDVTDVLAGTTATYTGTIPVDLPAYSALWLRCSRTA